MFVWNSRMHARTLWKYNASNHYAGKGINTQANCNILLLLNSSCSTHLTQAIGSPKITWSIKALNQQWTRKVQLTQRKKHNSGACLKARCNKIYKPTNSSNDVSFTLTRGREMAWPVSLSHIGIKSQIFLIPSHLAPSLGMTLLNLWILKLESDPSVWRTDRQRDEQNCDG